MTDNMQKTISVITVCFNAIQAIEKTILSVLNQRGIDIEYVIVDGGSTDGTIDVINEYKDRLAIFVSEPDRGIYDAMNKGILLASGEWLIFMNAGDTFVSSHTLSELFGKIPPPEKLDVVRIVRGNIIRKYTHFRIKSSGVTSQEPGLMDMFSNTFHHQACLIQRSLFKDFGLFSTDYKLCSDWKFFFDCIVLHHVKSIYVDIDVAYFEMDGATSLNTQQNEREQNAYLQRVLGNELYGIVRELSIYRKSSLCRFYCKTYSKLRNNLSPKCFNRILTAKRIIRSFLRLKVN